MNDAELATSYRQLMVGQGGKTEQIVYAKPTRLLCFAVARPAFAAALAWMCEEAPRPTSVATTTEGASSDPFG